MGGACGTNGGEMKCIQSFGGETEEKRSLGRRKHVDGRMNLQWILKKWDGSVWTGLIWLRIWQVVSFCDNINESSGSIKWWRFIE